jgi:uncharacterized protein YegJ (DUF2314 family)
MTLQAGRRRKVLGIQPSPPANRAAIARLDAKSCAWQERAAKGGFILEERALAAAGRLVPALTLVLWTLLSLTAPLRAEDKVVPFASDDPVMNAAIARARDTLPVFWEKFKTPGPGEDGFALKIKITDGEAVEHFWCGEVAGDAEKASCVIANEPQSVQNIEFGQKIDVVPDLISDWMYLLDGKFVGAETLRVILPTLPKEEADELRRRFAEP